MSFSRARISRFNEITTCTPSPADYNPKTKSCTGGAVIPQSDRFPDSRSAVNSDTTSIHSINSTPCFRTPTMLKKKKVVSYSSGKTKPMSIFVNPEDAETLKEKIVECNNKDVFIKDLTEQIEEMKGHIDILEKQKEELDKDKANFESRTDNLKQKQQVAIDNLNVKHQRELKDLEDRINSIKNELQLISFECRELKEQRNSDVKVLLANIDKFQLLYTTTIETHNREIKRKEDVIKNKEKRVNELETSLNELSMSHAEEIKKMQEKHLQEFQDVEFEMLKSIADMQMELKNERQNCINNIADLDKQKLTEISNLKLIFENESLKLQSESQAQLKQIEENCKEANLLAEIQLHEKYRDVELTWKIKLENKEKEADEILKECQAISEYNIIQCELEKNEVTYNLSNALKEIEEIKINKNLIETKYNELKFEFNQAIADFNTRCQKLKQEKLDREVANQQALAEKHTYEVTISKTHKTIEALKKRLFDSDRDVEQLKSELETCELSKLNVEARCNELTKLLENAHKQNEDLELQNEATLKMTEEKIQTIRQELIQKVNEYQLIIDETIKTSRDKFEQKSSELKFAMEDLHHQQILNSEAQSLIAEVTLELERLEVVNDIYTSKNECLESSLDTVQKELIAAKETIKHLEGSHASIKQQLQDEINSNKKVEVKASKVNEEVEFLKKQMHQLQEKSDSYYKYCEYYKCKANEYEQEIEDMNKINKNYIDQSRKYDELLHKYEALTNTNTELENKIAEQESLIGPFREQLEAFELEHSTLISQMSDAENEARQMGLKYAQILGHQNQKQKIKHLVDLKFKNNQLREQTREMECKLRTQAKTIEKLKNELKSKNPKKSVVKSTNKENINSPNRSLNGSHISCLLKDRN